MSALVVAALLALASFVDVLSVARARRARSAARTLRNVLIVESVHLHSGDAWTCGMCQMNGSGDPGRGHGDECVLKETEYLDGRRP